MTFFCENSLMEIIKSKTKFKKVIKLAKAQGNSIGFVPTMGYLHQGHISLIEQCLKENDLTVVSIFVNPAQFAPNLDLDRYPRNLERDQNILVNAGVDYLFYPPVADIYPDDYATWVEVEKLTSFLDGASRPGYFKGICTVVLKLFNIVNPDTSYFGQKDLQQALVIKKMIADLHLDIELKILPIVREADGLAMSSRNAYLNEKERAIAPQLYQALLKAQQLYLNGEVKATILIEAVKSLLKENNELEIDYVEIVDLQELQPLETIKDRGCLALAINLHGTRLIDNIILEKNIYE